MERLRRVASLWSWLPAFRAVAETQHLPTASRQLFVSASALSRTIRLLEEDLNQPLFLRHGRRIELNEAGQRLLTAVRDAMRLVHEGILAVQSTSLEGSVYVCTDGTLTENILLRGLTKLRGEHPALLPEVSAHPHRDIAGLLLRGQLDVAFVSEPLVHAELSRVHLGTETSAVYCGVGHPFFGAAAVEPEALAEHPFVTLSADERGISRDRWPATRPRKIGLVVQEQGLALEACAQGDLLAVLPDRIAGLELHRGRLHRLETDLVPPTELFAFQRQTLAQGGRAEALVNAVRAALAEPPSV